MFIIKTPPAATLVLIGSLSFTQCGNSNTDSASEKKNAPGESRTVSVRVQELRPRPFVETLQLAGAIKAIDDISVSPEEGGVVKHWKYPKGAFVPKGSVIVQLNDDVIKPGYEAANAQFKSAELTFDKQQKVYSEQAVSEWQLKTTSYNRDAAKAQADLMKARWERTKIKSPVGGILDERYADEGEMAPPGVPIARIVKIDRVKVVVNVPERYSGTITRGTALSLTVLAYPDEVFTGTVSYVGAAVNSDNRTFPVESIIANPGMKLKPEMIGKVKLSQSKPKNALLVEEGIVQHVDRNTFVVYVENGGKAVERIVQLGGRQDNFLEILSGVKAGERVITSGYQDVINGIPVQVQNSGESDAQ